MEQPNCRGSTKRKDPFGFDPLLRARVKPFFRFLATAKPTSQRRWSAR